MRAKGHGAHVLVTEVDPVRALEAAMDGYEVLPMRDAIARSDFVVTATGDVCVVDEACIALAKDGCVLANAGHFDVEVDVAALRRLSTATTHPRPSVEEHRLADGRRLRLLCEGRLVNLAAAEGHPSAVMDMSFANQASCVEWLLAHADRLGPGVHPVPPEIDAEIARLKLVALGMHIDALTEAQRRYLSSWQQGT